LIQCSNSGRGIKFFSFVKVSDRFLGGACSTYGRGAYRILVGRPEVKRPLGRPRRRWEDNIKIDVQEARCGGMDWIDMAQDRVTWRALVNAVMNLRVP
jgi:hypothetical protein